jgi:hypothetical protein
VECNKPTLGTPYESPATGGRGTLHTDLVAMACNCRVAWPFGSGKFSLRRDLDDEQGYYLIHIGFELESDAEKLAQLLRATKVEAYAGYSSAFEFDPALLSPGPRKNRRAKAAMAH